MDQKIFYIDEVREMVRQFNKEEISLSKLVELLNEKTLYLFEREKQLEATVIKLLHMMANLRYVQKICDENFGFDNKLRKKRAEARADDMLKEMGISESTDFKHIRIDFFKNINVFKNDAA